MQSRFGQTLFGAALGIVTAAGLAGAVAVASGKMEVRKRILLNPAACASKLQGKIYRTTKGKAQSASAFATSSNLPKAFKNGNGLAASIAQANGWAHAVFNGYGEAITHGYMNGHPIRLAKLRPISAKAYATAFGEGFVFLLLYPKEAIGRATGFGTTYHLAYGNAHGVAEGSGRVECQVGFAGHAIATAEIYGWVHYTAAMYPAIANGEAYLRWEPAVRIGGVRHLDAWGTAEAGALAELTTWLYYPSVNAFAYANAQVSARYQLGIAGHGQAEALLEGTMIGASTSAGIVQSDSIAVATGQLRSFPKGYGHAVVSASGSGNAVIKKTGLGQCEGIARCTVSQVLDAVVINTKAHPDDGYGVAKGRAVMNRVRSMSGRAGETFSYGYGASVKTQFIHSVGKGTAVTAGILYKIIVGKGTPVSAKATLINYLQINVSPPPAQAIAQGNAQIKKHMFASGKALAIATGAGFNQVNDAVKAPATRTVLVNQELRTVVVLAESRTVFV